MQDSINDLKQNSLNINDYTIMVSNLDEDLTIQEIKQHFYKLTRRKVEKINIAYDIYEYKETFKKKIELIEQLNYLKNSNVMNDYLKENLKKIPEEIKLQTQKMENLQKQFQNEQKKSGTAFITFSNQYPARILIEQYGVTFVRTVQFLIFGWFFKPYPIIKKNFIFIQKPPEPTEIIWENLGISYYKLLQNYLALQFVSIFLLIFSFTLQYSLTLLFMTTYSPITASGLIILSNLTYRQIVRIYAKKFRFISLSKQHQSVLFMNCLFFSLTSFFQPYLQKNQLQAIEYTLLSNAFLQPIIKIFNPYHLFKFIRSFDLEYMTQYNAQKLFEHQQVIQKIQIYIIDSYEQTIKLLYLSCFYAHCTPFFLIFVILGLIFSQFINWIYLIRFNNWPKQIGLQFIEQFVKYLEILPYIYYFGVIVWEHGIQGQQGIWGEFSRWLGYGVGYFGLAIVTFLQWAYFKDENIQIDSQLSDTDYRNARKFFTQEYDRINPVTSHYAIQKWHKFQRKKSLNSNETSQNLNEYINQRKRSSICIRFELNDF